MKYLQTKSKHTFSWALLEKSGLNACAYSVVPDKGWHFLPQLEFYLKETFLK